MHSLYVYSSQISSPSYVTHFTSHHSQKSPLLCLLDHISQSVFASESSGLNWRSVLRVVNEVWMCVRADLYQPHVQEQETSCLLFCLFLVLFMLLFIPGSLLIAKTEHFLNTLMLLLYLKEPELQMPISW